MPRFFVNGPLAVGDTAVIDSADARHIAGALRMAVGESLTLCDGNGTDYAATITAIGKDAVTVSVDNAAPNATEPSLAVTLYMGMPKGDKLEFVIQKAVELGVTKVVPVVTARSIVRVSGKDAEKKQVRLQRIAAEAAGQCGRGIIPTVYAPIDFKTALARLKEERVLLCYEGGGAPIGTLVTPDDTAVSLVIGPEGGFAPEEVEAIKALGGRIATLGPRILRCETAPLAALAVLMEKSGNMV
ncbi:MAG: 16S rRNA (uracil(1498)-N(3))-methyltransferase [Clostridia bacterium]|nr:16S rRNA (uracil(1498)-N(3))-methyltransferase [Clostridia bacterium]